MNYELTDIVRTFDGVTLRQVKAVRDLEQVGVRAGAYGGFVQSAANLAQRGTCWVHGRRASLSASAVVMGRARVRQGGQVTGRAVVRDQAVVEGNATITDDSIVCDRARVGGAARISGGSVVFGVNHGSGRPCSATATPMPPARSCPATGLFARVVTTSRLARATPRSRSVGIGATVGVPVTSASGVKPLRTNAGVPGPERAVQMVPPTSRVTFPGSSA